VTPQQPMPPFKALFITGGTGTGRRTAAKIIAEGAMGLRPCVVDAFYFELRERCHAAYKLFDAQRLPAPANYFDDQLDVPTAYFGDKTPRYAYSKFARFVNDAMGPDAPGLWVTQRLTYYRKLQEKMEPEKRVRAVVLFDDAPTPSYEAVVKYIGAEHCSQLLVRRDGTVSLAVDLPGVRKSEVKNPGDTIAGFESAIRKAAPHLFIEIVTTLP